MTRRISALTVLAALVGAFLLYLSVPNIGPVLRAAHAGEGTPGVFVPQRLSCVSHPGHTACDWQGEFRSADGRAGRHKIFLYGGAGDLKTGIPVYARDVGRAGHVYRRPGTHEWIPTGLLALGGVLMLVAAGRTLRPRRRPGMRAETTAGAVPAGVRRAEP